VRNIAAGLITGFLFGLGLCVASMTDPAVIQGFLDIAGDWNPTLVFVMAGGVVVTFVGYRMIFPRGRPLWAGKFLLPSASAIDRPLLVGAAIFGIGWGLAGYCPGPAVVSLASGRLEIFLFVLAMLVGMISVRWMRAHLSATMPATPAEGHSA
jgi:uncharacterized protein